MLEWPLVTYSIIARDPDTGEMGLASQSQAFAVGSSVPWAEPGHGVIATQSMGEPMYGQLGLDLLKGGLTAPEALAALRSIDPHPERRQVAMLDATGALDVYTGEACVAEAGHQVGDGCWASLANLVASPRVWEAMIEGFEAATGSLAQRLMAALAAAEDAGGDLRGRRSAAVLVVRAERTGRPWRDQVVDLRVDDHPDPVAELTRLVAQSERYHHTVEAFEAALNGNARRGVELLEAVGPADVAADPDQAVWRAVVHALAGDDAEAGRIMGELDRRAPAFVEAARRFLDVGLLPEPDRFRRTLPGR